MNKTIFKKALKEATGCTIQHNWRPCGTCFFSIGNDLNNQDRQALLLYRGDYKKKDLNNLPKDLNKSLEKIAKIIDYKKE